MDPKLCSIHTVMIDPIMIATLAFQEFIKSGSGELAKKFTGEAIAKMGQLRELIWHRLRGKHPAAEQALEQAQAGEQEGINTVATLLGVEMLDQEFAEQVQAIAESVCQEILKSNSGTEIHQTVTGKGIGIGQMTGGTVIGNVKGNVTLRKLL